MAYQVNMGIGAVPTVSTFILDGFAADASPAGGGYGIVHQKVAVDHWHRRSRAPLLRDPMILSLLILLMTS